MRDSPFSTCPYRCRFYFAKIRSRNLEIAQGDTYIVTAARVTLLIFRGAVVTDRPMFSNVIEFVGFAGTLIRAAGGMLLNPLVIVGRNLWTGKIAGAPNTRVVKRLHLSRATERNGGVENPFVTGTIRTWYIFVFSFLRRSPKRQQRVPTDVCTRFGKLHDRTRLRRSTPNRKQTHRQLSSGFYRGKL